MTTAYIKQGAVSLSPNCHLLRARQAREKANGTPNLVILCAWMGANDRHVVRYVAGYQRLFPTSDILVITTSVMDVIFTPLCYQRTCLRPCVPIIKSAATSESARIVLHLLSGGGAHASGLLAQEYLYATGDIIPMTSMVLDSSPGRSTYYRGYNAIIESLPQSRCIRMAVSPIIHLALAILWSLDHGFGIDTRITKARQRLNDERLIPLSARRLYLYSIADKIVRWQDVEDHARRAESLGWVVERNKVDTCSHVAIMKGDPVKYWSAVEDISKT